MTATAVRVTAAATLAVEHPTRIRSLIITNAGPAGVLELFDGGSTGTRKFFLDVPSSTHDMDQIDFLEGIRFFNNVYTSVSNTLIDFNLIYG